MTPIDDVFMLSINTHLNFGTVSNIMRSGFSRIPVFDRERSNIVSVLYIKDLALVDPDDNMPIKSLSDSNANNCFYVFEDTPLDFLFKQFKEGSKGHMAFVHRVNSEGEGDPFYESVGIVTLEDVIEEIIQAEIVDETDVYTDNKSKRRRQRKLKDFSDFFEMSESQKVRISPQLALACFQFMSTLDSFKPSLIGEAVLKKILKLNVFRRIKIKNKEERNDPKTIIFEQGKPVDYFVLILEGRVEVTIGKENLIFESGPFIYFGLQVLTLQNIESASGGGGSTMTVTEESGPASALGSLQSVVQIDSKQRLTFAPDYTVRPVTDVFYLKLPRCFYLAGHKVTQLQRAWTGEAAAINVDESLDLWIRNFSLDDGRSQITVDSPEVTRAQSQVSMKANKVKEGIERSGSVDETKSSLAEDSEVVGSQDTCSVHLPGPSLNELPEEHTHLLPQS